MKRLSLTAAALLLGWGAVAGAKELRISHQWNTNDVRHEMAEVLAAEVAKADVGLEIKIYPKRELFKPREQYEPLMSGELDMSIYTLAYSGNRHREYALTLMPALVKNHEHAYRLTRSPFMQEIEEILAKDDIMVLVHGYLAGGFGGVDRCIRHPRDVDGLQARAAGSAFEVMLEGAGATIESMSSPAIYGAIEEGRLQAANTSSASFVSFKLYEKLACYTPAGAYSLWFVYIPILMSKSNFEALTPEQQEALRAAALVAENYYRDEAKKQDAMSRRVFEEKGVQIADMTEGEFQEWYGIAKETSYEAYLAAYPNGMRLLDMALSVE
ncbi:MAG: TRAP transporter substrate-binding protein DctP [Pseudomonadota bacterium]